MPSENDNKLVNLADLKAAYDDLNIVASQSANGLMSSADKTKLDGIASGAQVNTVTGVKGSVENAYRTGNVNLTPANIGAMADDAILQYGQSIPIPAEGTTARYNVVGMDALYQLVCWNFSQSPENAPPVSLSWATYIGYFTITNNGGTTSQSIQPVFIPTTLRL